MAQDPYTTARQHMDGIAGCSCCVGVLFIAAVVTALFLVIV